MGRIFLQVVQTQSVLVWHSSDIAVVTLPLFPSLWVEAPEPRAKRNGLLPFPEAPVLEKSHVGWINDYRQALKAFYRN